MCQDCKKAPAFSFLGLPLLEEFSEATRRAMAPYNDKAANLKHLLESDPLVVDPVQAVFNLFDELREDIVALDFEASLTTEELRKWLSEFVPAVLVETFTEQQLRIGVVAYFREAVELSCEDWSQRLMDMNSLVDMFSNPDDFPN